MSDSEYDVSDYEEEVTNEEVSEEEVDEEEETSEEEVDESEEEVSDEEETDEEVDEEVDEESDEEEEVDGSETEYEDESGEECEDMDEERLAELKTRLAERIKKLEGQKTMYDLLKEYFCNVDENKFFFGKGIDKVITRLSDIDCLPLYHPDDEDLQDVCISYEEYAIELCKSIPATSFAEEHVKMIKEKILKLNAMYDDTFSDLRELESIFNDLL